jgi:hypothetical protein
MTKKNNRNNKSKGAKQTTQAPMTIQQPKPNYNTSSQDARYITDLNPVGSPEFNRWNEQLGGNYDGGGWVTWNKNKGPGDSGMLASDDDMRAFARANAYREMNNIGLMNRGSVESDAAKFQAPGTTPSGSSANGTTSSGRKKLKDAESMGQALRIAGGGSGNITNKERLQIGRQFNVGDDKIIRRLDAVNEKRTSKRKASYALGGNAFNKLTSGDPTLNFGTGAIGQAVRGGMPQMYGNQNSSRGMTNPLQVRKGVSVTGLTAKGDIDTREKFLGSGSFNRPQMKATDTGSGTTTVTNTGTQSTGSTGMNNQPMTPQEMADASTIGGMLSGGGAGAMGATRLGRAKSRLKRLGIYGEGTNLLGRGLQYGINLNK